MSKKKRVGIMGGTFNPIHLGHLILAENAYEELQLDEVLFVPSGNPYMKDCSQVLDAKTRIDLVGEAIEDNSHFALSRIEVDRGGNSYSYETIAALKKDNPDTEYFFMVGADSLFMMDKWMCPEKIFGEVTFAERAERQFVIGNPARNEQAAKVISAEEFAGQYYDIQGYPEDGILLLVSAEEGQWYILTNGECYRRISDSDAAAIGEELVPMFKSGSFYAAFLKFPELAAEIFAANEPTQEDDNDMDVAPSVPKKTYGKTIAICMGVGLLIGLVTVGIMASKMKSVRMQSGASDYVRPGSMQLTNSRDIFLYSHVTRTPKPKNNSSSGGGGRSGGGSRGGAGGRF